MEPIQERRRLNEEIERSFITTAASVVSIQTYHQTKRGIGLIDLYEQFYSSFALLVELTADLEQLHQHEDTVKATKEWINRRINVEKDSEILYRLSTGLKAFSDYKKILSDQSIISLPKSGR